MKLNKQIIKRVEEEADYIIETKETIRKVASKFRVSKSTVHKDIKERLKELDFTKFKIIQDIFSEHIRTRHILGGESTRIKYLRERKS